MIYERLGGRKRKAHSFYFQNLSYFISDFFFLIEIWFCSSCLVLGSWFLDLPLWFSVERASY